MKSMKKCVVTKEKISKSIKLDKRRSNRRRSSAGMFYTSSAGAVTSLICFGNQKMLSRTRVAPARRHGRSALILGRNLRNVLYSIFLITLPVLFVHQAHATASTLTISVTDSVALNITSINSTGTFATSDTSTNNISIKTTNGTGYTLGIKASTEGSNALNGANSTSIPSHTVSAGISEATYSTDSTYNNTWGYRPSKLNSTANSNYLPGPTSASTAITLDKTTSANPTSSNNYNLAIGVRVDGNTAAGAYSNTFIITVVANPSVYSITYNKNTTDTVSNMPTNVVNQETSSETVTLANNTPTRTGYTFQDWCTVQVADGATCTGTAYSPGSTWTIDQTASTNSLTLYARWKASTNKYCTNWSTCMQNTTSTKPACGSTMTDGRDGATYTTATIGSKCWMTQNLRFTGDELKIDETNIDEDKNLTWDDLTNGSIEGTPCWGYGSVFVTSNIRGDGYTKPCKHDSNDTSTGVWYNYAGATAATITGISNSATANYSICPKGWRLPTDNEQSSIQSQTTTYSPIYGGYYTNGNLNEASTRGLWWSSTAYSSFVRNRLYYAEGSLVTYFGAARYEGLYVRCVRDS